MTFRTSIQALGAGTLFFAMACAKGEPIIGTWKATRPSGQTFGEETRTIDPNGTFHAEFALAPNHTFAVTIFESGEWKRLDASHYWFHYLDTRLTNQGMYSPERNKQGDEFNLRKAEHLAEDNKNMVYTVKWLDDDNFSLTGGPHELDFTRKG